MTSYRNVKVELSRFRGRVLAISVVVVLAFGLLASRLVYLQVVRHDDLSEQAESNRTAVLPIVPNRGLILDRNGVVLANQLLGLHTRNHAIQGREPRRHHRRDCHRDPCGGQGQAALQETAGRVEEL